MMSLTGAPADVPPLPWWKYPFALLGVPFHMPTVWDDDPAPDPRERRR